MNSKVDVLDLEIFKKSRTGLLSCVLLSLHHARGSQEKDIRILISTSMYSYESSIQGTESDLEIRFMIKRVGMDQKSVVMV
jgi:hypothetical protein